MSPKTCASLKKGKHTVTVELRLRACSSSPYRATAGFESWPCSRAPQTPSLLLGKPLDLVGAPAPPVLIAGNLLEPSRALENLTGLYEHNLMCRLQERARCVCLQYNSSRCRTQLPLQKNGVVCIVHAHTHIHTHSHTHVHWDMLLIFTASSHSGAVPSPTFTAWVNHACEREHLPSFQPSCVSLTALLPSWISTGSGSFLLRQKLGRSRQS